MHIKTKVTNNLIGERKTTMH